MRQVAAGISHDHVNDDGTGEVGTELNLCSQPYHVTSASTLLKYMSVSVVVVRDPLTYGPTVIFSQFSWLHQLAAWEAEVVVSQQAAAKVLF